VLRRAIGQEAIERTKSTFEEVEGYEVLVAITEDTSAERERSLVRIAADIARKNDGSVTVVQFDEVPDQAPLEQVSETLSPADEAFERRTAELTEEFDVPIQYGEIVSHDVKHAIVNFAEHEAADFLLLEREDESPYAPIFGTSGEWITRKAPCDVLLIEERNLTDIHSITVVTDEGPFDPQKIAIANALASETGSRIDLLYPVTGSATEAQRETIDEYLAELEELCSVPVYRSVVESDDPAHDFVSATDPADVLIIGTDGSRLRRNLFGRPADWIVDSVDCTAVQIEPSGSERPGLFRRLVERIVF
jgi:nucleotide-binding universal stress UspA family protein